MTAVFDRLAALSDPIRCRILLALERQDLVVNELRTILQLPQSTVSRHLKLLADEGWITSRADGTSNWYRLAVPNLDDGARQLWSVVRGQLAGTPPAIRDAARLATILADRRVRSQAFFSSSAGDWDRLRAELYGPNAEWLCLGGLLDPGWTVADLGCGSGQLTAGLAPLVQRVVAIDESDAMLQVAAERCRDLANVDCRLGTLEALPLESESADLAVMSLVLHHLPEPARATREAYRILRSCGKLVVVDMMPHEQAAYRDTMGHQWLGFDAELIRNWFHAAGFGHTTYRSLPPDATTKGPLLFVATAEKLIEGRTS
ncbi:MAG: metalloregulator ArsR/SmtB family transcription factor [Gemmatimonadales bacterium]|nr:metalloregulator ArsR/SmtB family transcription factor [Gemmatimonadales bacterium]